MRTQVTLREYESVTVDLADAELRGLLAADGSKALAVSPVGGGQFRLTANSLVGTVVTPHLSVLIRPKVALENVFLMLGVSVPSFLRSQFLYATDGGLLPAMAAVFADVVDRATVQGVLHGYRSVDERLVAPRGRIDLVEQLRRPSTPIPAACRFDDYTTDILLNRGILSAISRLSRVPALSPQLRERLARVRARFGDVSPAVVRAEQLDRWRPTRLDGHYESAVRLASVVLRNLTLRDQAGAGSAASFTIDMNSVFQAFVLDRLQRVLVGRIRVVGEPSVPLSSTGSRIMSPDLVFERESSVVLVGDAKYKLSTGQARIGDYYQLLAYTTVMELDEGVLVYCQDSDDEPEHSLAVRNSGKTLWTYRLPMAGTVAQVEGQIHTLGEWVTDRTAARPLQGSTVGS